MLLVPHFHYQLCLHIIPHAVLSASHLHPYRLTTHPLSCPCFLAVYYRTRKFLMDYLVSTCTLFFMWAFGATSGTKGPLVLTTESASERTGRDPLIGETPELLRLRSMTPLFR
ncbi:hypothetical protein BD311DRAFT_299693 [Dichomitus squalens]|uniref:Uncharacterized protein n=1 Tax=Dichomitus squalens TaxID=114155 RepID=A0A4Q9MSB6_9APHY|nr:hypothetical protein BD311DRAFT_299693 [Dichomitus squalens]